MDGDDLEHDPDADWSLPAWTYRDPEFLSVECARIFRRSWQIAAHESALPSPGDFQRLDLTGESVLIIRGEDGIVRAFTNVCRHRGARIASQPSGCARRLICPYHGWTYDSAGRLTGLPDEALYGGIDRRRLGLAPVELENFHGFLFVRLEASAGPSVAQMLAPLSGEIAAHRFGSLRPLGRVTERVREANWKIVGDNYADALHVATAHPGLKRLMGGSYRLESFPYADRMRGSITTFPSANLSERAYQHFLPTGPEAVWSYIRLWPNMAFDIYPDQIDFMQWLPLSPTRTLIREVAFALPDDRREMRAARYLNWRINRQVSAEDKALIERVQAGLASASYSSGPLASTETGLRQFNRRMRAIVPEARSPHPPPAGWSASPPPLPALVRAAQG